MIGAIWRLVMVAAALWTCTFPGLANGFRSGTLIDWPRAPIKRIAVFGTDDRTNVPARFEAVAGSLGLLFNNRSRTVCSAFCVAGNVIATAAHCLHRSHAGSAVRFSDFLFSRGFDKSRDQVKIDGAATGSAAQNIIAGDFKMRVRPPIDAAHDWALLRLQREACLDGGLRVKALAPETVFENAKAGRVFQISYHRDWAQWRPAYTKACRVSRDFENAPWPAIAPDFINPEQILLHTCDTGGASSGSPLLMETEEGPVVVGINVGTYVQSKMASQRGQMVRQRSETIANTGVNAAAFEGLIEPLKNAAILPSGAQIRQLQEQLKRRNLYGGQLDGSYGPGLKTAIEAHERASQQPVTGLPTQSLLMMLAAEPPSGGAMAPSSATDKPPTAQGR